MQRIDDTDVRIVFKLYSLQLFSQLCQKRSFHLMLFERNNISYQNN